MGGGGNVRSMLIFTLKGLSRAEVVSIMVEAAKAATTTTPSLTCVPSLP